jgi:hypothetical protein
VANIKAIEEEQEMVTSNCDGMQVEPTEGLKECEEHKRGRGWEGGLGQRVEFLT